MKAKTIPPSKPTVYVETTIVSYLAGRPSRDALLSVHQTLTHEWWAKRSEYVLHTSQLVLDESNVGDADRVAERKILLNECQFLEITQEDLVTAQALLDAAALPAKARADATHIAIAARHNISYLLTWNCKHIANPFTLRTIQSVVEGRGYNLPYLLTPELLLETHHAENDPN
jgi:predicted nucleic acid-binding protein